MRSNQDQTIALSTQLALIEICNRQFKLLSISLDNSTKFMIIIIFAGLHFCLTYQAKLILPLYGDHVDHFLIMTSLIISFIKLWFIRSLACPACPACHYKERLLFRLVKRLTTVFASMKLNLKTGIGDL